MFPDESRCLAGISVWYRGRVVCELYLKRLSHRGSVVVDNCSMIVAGEQRQWCCKIQRRRTRRWKHLSTRDGYDVTEMIRNKSTTNKASRLRCRQKKRHDVLCEMLSYNILNTSEMTCFSCGFSSRYVWTSHFLFDNLLILWRGVRLCLSTADNYKIKEKQYSKSYTKAFTALRSHTHHNHKLLVYTRFFISSPQLPSRSFWIRLQIISSLDKTAS